MYSKWQAKNTDGTKVLSIEEINPATLLQFTVSDTTNKAVTVCRNKGQECWFEGGVAFNPPFPLLLPMRDGTTITVVRVTDEPFDLIFTQQ